MSDAYSPAGWAVFAGTSATAAAALAGFLFIAVSINLRQIIDSPGLPGRVALTLILLATPLVSTLLLTVPGQGRVVLGLELLGWAWPSAPPSASSTTAHRGPTRRRPGRG